MVIEPGTVLSKKYQIIEHVGTGGMGAVYRAREIDFDVDRYVAVKVLPPQLACDEKLVQRFREEIKIAAKLDHPHIVPIYNFGQEEDCLFLVMKYLKGETLKSRLARTGPFNPGLVTHLMLQICRAVDHIHREGAIHRDIKSVNIMLDDDQNATLMDFGIAKLEGGADLTCVGEVLGTSLYMAPEQWMGKTDHRTDIYALGVVMYETLTGGPPFMADRVPTIMRMHLQQAPAPLRSVRPQVPEQLAEVVHRCLAKEPAQRYDTCADLVKALEFVDRHLPRQAAMAQQPEDMAATMISKESLTPPPDPLAATVDRADQLLNDGLPQEAFRLLSDVCGGDASDPALAGKLDEMAQLAKRDDAAKKHVETLLANREYEPAERAIIAHLKVYPASRIGGLLAKIQRGAATVPHKVDEPTVRQRSPVRQKGKGRIALWSAVGVVTLLALLAGLSFIFNEATSRGLTETGHRFYGAQWYGSPPLLNATTCYKLALVYNGGNRKARSSLDNMAQHLWSVARGYHQRGQIKSAMKYLDWAIDIDNRYVWVKTYNRWYDERKRK